MSAQGFAQTAPVAPGPAAPAPVTPAAPAAAPATVVQEGSSADSEIVVTARRRDESVQDVPAVVNAVTSADIAKLNLREFNEVQTLVPGLQLTSSANGIGGNAQLRGVNFNINASGFNPTVEFYLNDAPITAGVILQQIYDIGQIEVLRGPQGTLRGRASPSGAITITTKKPDLYRVGGFADLTANDIGTQNAQAGFNLPIVEGIAAVRVAGVINQDNGNNVRTISATGDLRDPYSQTRSGRVSAVVAPIDWLRFEGMYQHVDRYSRQWEQLGSFNQVNGSAPASPTLIRAKDYKSNLPRPNITRQIFDIYNGRAEATFAGQQLIYQFQHYTQKIDSQFNFDYAAVFPTTPVTQVTAARIRSTSHEVRLQNQERVLGVFDYVVGGFDNVNVSPTNLTSPTVVRLPLAFGGGVATVVQTPISRRGRSHERSLFGNLTAHIGEATEISGGLRYINFKDNGSLSVNGAVISVNTADDNKFIYTGSIKHSFSPSLMVYASTGSSYRPGINTVGDFNITPSPRELSFLNLGSESSKSYEVGFKSTLFGGLRANVSAYHQTFKNYPYRAGSGVFYVNTVAVRNAAGAVTSLAQQVNQFNFVAAVPLEVNGVEAEFAGDISSQWNVGLVASYALGKIKKGIIPCNDLNGDGRPDTVTATPTLAQLQAAVGANNLGACTTNQRSAFLPPLSVTLQSEYHLPITNGVDGFLRGLANFAGKSQTDPSNAFDDVKSYGTLNLFVGIRDPKGQWELTAFAKNLTNTIKVLSRSNPVDTSYQQLGFGGIGPAGPILTGPTGAVQTGTYNIISTTPMREFGLNAKFRFGSH
ncbi:TonB-dependent receptor [Sphingomonas ginsenosidivorax]|uniref:TonB-dependent receptor n=1 Tax=Sphingomonas ginsenosidivorax TaxID=862135 RepID=A0A5C6UJ84_9SPHN|nr:TonB-dependent receptor [Sphingomonas ginsenosidivorax]